MPEPNDALRAARLRLPSPQVPGTALSRQELADAANAWLHEHTDRRGALDAHYIGKCERGSVRWPGAEYRAALRAVLRVRRDAELGFRPPRRASDATAVPGLTAQRWNAATVAEEIAAITEHDLATPIGGTPEVVTTGTGLITALEPVLRPPLRPGTHRGSAFSVEELDALEQLTAQFRGRHANGEPLVRFGVLAQIHDHVKRLAEAPQGKPTTMRGFRVGADLTLAAGTMFGEERNQAAAQRYFRLAAQLAHAGGAPELAAVAMTALARQCFDLGRPADGLEIVQLVQYATRRSATPRLRAVLATREAWAYAQLGDAKAFERSVALAQDHHTEGERDIDRRTPTVRSLDLAELAGTIGARYRDLARYNEKYARNAQRYINRALDLRSADRTRNRAFDLIGLARTHLLSREPDRAAELVGEALPLAVTWASGRVGAKLRDFHRESAPFERHPAMRERRAAILDLTGG